MDEYDELFEIEDKFEDQFADELEVLAAMEEDESFKPSKRQKRGQGDDISDIEHLLDEPTTPKTKRQRQEAGVAKRLFDPGQRKAPQQSYDITPPSSPEQYDLFDTARPVRSVMDISGLATIPETPSRPPTAAPPSQHVLKRPPLEGDYITVTDSSGNRVYLRQKEDAGTKVASSRIVPDSFGALGLLTVPIGVLREQEIKRRHDQLVEESERLTELLTGSVNDVIVEPESIEDKESDDLEDIEGQMSRLWVDRFSPRHYTELLSDDNPNRFKTKVEMTEEILEAELDQYKRPKFKVALLSGPPGLGKTTLAHIIAKHAGYNVVEINASDDRSAEVFQKRIDTATQMKSVLGVNEKPNCLIIDEIDGAPTAAINILLAALNRKDGHSGEATETMKKKKKKESILLRPIICICNDLYVPALRPLRQQAFLLTFPQTQPSRLSQRLTEISLLHGMKADTGALMSLCEKTDNDIRACINTLQFLYGRGLKQVDVRTIQSVSVGQKDQNKGLFHLWQEIFQLPRTKRKRIGEGFEEAPGSGSGSQRFHHVLHLASSSGEYEKVSQGLYDNYLSMRIRDPNLQSVCEALEWLSFSDRLNQEILHCQNFSLMRYLPFLSVTFHFLFAHTHVPRITYPHSQHEAFSRLNSSRNALSTMLSDIPACIRTRTSQQILALDMLPLLLDILCPKLRPDTMLAYNLSYRQDRTPEGQYTYVLEPRVEEVVRYPSLPPRRQLTYQAKQTISREMEQEKMRRAEQLILQRNPAGTLIQKQEEKKNRGSKLTSNHQQRLENIVKQTTVEARPEVDFFGRAITPKPRREQLSSDRGEKCPSLLMGKAVGNSDVWFRFNEGMSNAVRRNVYIRELL
ncbi:hypothetical protein fugu_008006 [Takifugu bimaculatus]|uniref:Chromosome transmission fidelity protein 18 homolog n=1 Tax=Takifugu bimaculatus TaxID=433685 RepID=A0A4Z2B192_9TELE|nr:hypothetical protein fugu_008006 [Takifugu bimaculatus]